MYFRRKLPMKNEVSLCFHESKEESRGPYISKKKYSGCKFQELLHTERHMNDGKSCASTRLQNYAWK